MGLVPLLGSALLAVVIATVAQGTIGLMLAGAVARRAGPFSFYVTIIATGFGSAGLGSYLYRRLRPAASQFSTVAVFVLSVFATFIGVWALFVVAFMRGGGRVEL